MGSMRLSWGQWGSVEIVRGPMGVSGDRWCSMGVFGAHSGSVGLSGGSVVLCGAQCAMYLHP